MMKPTSNCTTYRPTIAYLIVSVLSVIWSLFMGGIGVTVAVLVSLGSYEPAEIAAVVGMMGCFAGFFYAVSFLSCYFVAAYYRYRLLFSSEEITEQGVFYTKTIRLKDVEEVIWSNHWLGDILIRGAESSIRINRPNFFNEVDHKQIEATLRERILPEVHTGWKEYHAPVLNPERPKPPSIATNMVMAAVFFLAGIPFAYFGSLMGNPTFLACNLVLSTGGVFFGFRVWWYWNLQTEVEEHNQTDS